MTRPTLSLLAACVVIIGAWPAPVPAGATGPVLDLIFAAGFQTPDESFCATVEFGSAGAAPAERVTIENLPTTFRAPEIVASRAGQVLGPLTVIQETGSDPTFVAPLLENYQSAHELTLTLYGVFNGEAVSCENLGFSVTPLPAVTGDPAAETVASFRTSIDELKTLLGAPDIDLSQNPSTLPRPLRLLALADYLVQGSGNENALTRILDGTAPTLSQPDVTYDAELLRRLLVSSGTVAALEDLAAALAAEAALKSSQSKGALSLICPEDVSEPDELVECMESQSQLALIVDDRAKAAVLALTTGLGALAIVYPPASGYVLATGLVIFVVQTLAELVSEALPTEVGELQFDLTKNEFYEDEQGTSGSWNNVTVFANGSDVTLSWFTFIEAGLQILGPFASELGTLAPQFLAVAESVLLDVFQLVAAAANTILDIVVPADASALMTWPAISYGPVLMTDPQYYNVVVTPLFVSFDVTEAQRTYTKANLAERAPKSWPLTLESDLEAGYFPGPNRATGSQTISMPEIQIGLDAPFSASPGETVPVIATVDKAIDQTLNFDLQPARGTLDMGEPSEGLYTGTYTAPTSGSLPVIVTITATHPTIVERTESVQIRVGPEIEISPREACLKPGEQEQFSAGVLGLDNDAVTWEASAGSITSSGLYTAPNMNANVTITATSAVDPLTMDAVIIRVGDECECYFRAVVSGDTSGTFDGPAQFQITDDGTIALTFRSRGWINGDPTAVQAGVFTGPSNPVAPGTYGLDSGNVNFVAPIYSALYISGDDDFDCPACGGDLTIQSYDSEQSLTGTAIVTMVRGTPRPENDEQPTATMSVNFKAAFGSQFQGTSPYVRCSILYGDD